MTSFFYPTRDGWIEDMIEGWKESSLPYLSFSFLDFYPTKLPQSGPFWMYLYFTKTKTDDMALQMKVGFRVFVLEHCAEGFNDKDTYVTLVDEGTPKIWFKCSQLEEIRRIDGQFLTNEDFQHAENKDLLGSIHNSIAPVRRLVPIKIMQRTFMEIQD